MIPIRAKSDSAAVRASEAKAAITGQTAAVCAEQFGNDLQAIVLTGSLARDEGTFVEAGGDCRLLGDADFFLVFRNRARLPPTDIVASAGREVERRLHELGLVASAGLGVVHSSYFSSLPRHIATYELRTCGQVVWGDANILATIPQFAAEEISREDAWRMLANRMIELLDAIAGGEHPAETRYRTLKLYLDMATSYLVFVGRYFPTYRERDRALAQMAGSTFTQAPFALGPFARRVADCTACKLDGFPADAASRLWEDAVEHCSLLWNWELRQLAQMPAETPDAELMNEWMRRQPVAAKIRGWASVVRRSGWLRSWREWPRWIRLALRGSPRYWVYSVAADVFFRLPDYPEEQPAAGGLPWVDPAVARGDSVTWKRLARIAVANYERFLKGTTA